MRGAVNVWVAFGRMRRQVLTGVIDAGSTPGIQIITPLFFCKHSVGKSLILFSTLLVKNFKDFYESVVYYYINTWAETLSYFMPHSQVARQLGLAIAIRSIATCLPLLLISVLFLLMLMTMMMLMLALTMIILLDAFDVVAYMPLMTMPTPMKTCRMLLDILMQISLMVPMLWC